MHSNIIPLGQYVMHTQVPVEIFNNINSIYETKFKDLGGEVNQVARLGKAFDDIINTIKVALVNGLTPVLQFLSNNVTSLVSLFGLLALPLVRSVLPTLDAFGEAAKDAGDRATAFAERTQGKFDDLTKQTRILGKDMKEVGKSSADLAKGAGVKKGQTKGTGLLMTLKVFFWKKTKILV